MAKARARNLLTNVSTALLIMAAAGFALMVFNQARLFSVQSGSMSPYINKGDLLLVSQATRESIKTGDVVTYLNPANKQQTITHRVVETPGINNEDKFVTRGDANPVSDIPIAPDFILGKVAFSIPYAGYGLDFVRSTAGLILLIYIPAIIIIVSEMRRLINYFKSQQPYYASEAIRRRLLEREKEYDLGKGLRGFTALTLFLASMFSAQVFALTPPTATLTGNRIVTTSAPVTESETNKIRKDVQCYNSLDISHRNNQKATTGDAVVQNNNQGGRAATGAASNRSNSSVEISINCR